MALKDLFKKGQQLVEDRGGVDSLKADAAELQGIAMGKGSVSDKGKAALEAVKDPGVSGPDAPRAEVPEPAEPPTAPTTPESPQSSPSEPPAQDISPPAAVPPGGEAS